MYKSRLPKGNRTASSMTLIFSHSQGIHTARISYDWRLKYKWYIQNDFRTCVSKNDASRNQKKNNEIERDVKCKFTLKFAESFKYYPSALIRVKAALKVRYYFRVSHMGDREEYLWTPLPLPPSLYGRSLARSVVRWRHNQIFSAWWVTNFSYPWCFAGALRALKLRYKTKKMGYNEQTASPGHFVPKLRTQWPSHTLQLLK